MEPWSDDSWHSYQILAGCTASAVQLWDPWTPSHTAVRPSETVSSTAGPRRTLCWNANGKVLAYAGRFSYIVMQSGRDTELGLFPSMSRRKAQAWPSSATIKSLTFSRKSHYLLAGSDEGSLYVLNCKAQELAWKATKHPSAITSVSVAPDNDTVATASAEQVLLYSMDAEQRALLDRRPSGDSALAMPIGSCQEVSALAFSEAEALPGDKASMRSVLLAAAGGNGCVVAWRVADHMLAGNYSGLHQGPATGLCFGHDGPNVLYTCGLDRQICTVDFRTPRQAVQKAVAPAPLTCLHVRASTHNLAVGTSDGSMLIYETRQMQSHMADFQTGSEAILDIAWQPAKSVLRTSSASIPRQSSVASTAQPALSPVREMSEGPSPSLEPHATDPPYMMELSPAPAGVTPLAKPPGEAPGRRPAPEGLLGESISIPSFADLAENSPSPKPAGPSRRMTDGAAPIRQPDLAGAIGSQSAKQRAQPSGATGGQPLGRTSAPGGTTSSASRPSSSQSAAGSAAPESTSGKPSTLASSNPTDRRRSASSTLQAQPLASPGKAKLPGAASSRYGAATSSATTATTSTGTPAGLTKVATSVPVGLPVRTAVAPPSSAQQPAQAAAPAAPLALAGPVLHAEDSSFSSISARTSSVAGADAQLVQRGAGGRFITEEVFHSYNKAMEERMQESLQNMHLDMVRSFHMLQAEMVQLVEALAQRQDQIEGHVLRQQALLERLLQRSQSSSSWL